MPADSFLFDASSCLRCREKKWTRKAKTDGVADNYSLAASIAKSVVSVVVMWFAVSYFDAWITEVFPGMGDRAADSAAGCVSRRWSSCLLCDGRDA